MPKEEEPVSPKSTPIYQPSTSQQTEVIGIVNALANNEKPSTDFAIDSSQQEKDRDTPTGSKRKADFGDGDATASSPRQTPRDESVQAQLSQKVDDDQPQPPYSRPSPDSARDGGATRDKATRQHRAPPTRQHRPPPIDSAAPESVRSNKKRRLDDSDSDRHQYTHYFPWGQPRRGQPRQPTQATYDDPRGDPRQSTLLGRAAMREESIAPGNSFLGVAMTQNGGSAENPHVLSSSDSVTHQRRPPPIDPISANAYNAAQQYGPTSAPAPTHQYEASHPDPVYELHQNPPPVGESPNQYWGRMIRMAGLDAGAAEVMRPDSPHPTGHDLRSIGQYQPQAHGTSPLVNQPPPQTPPNQIVRNPYDSPPNGISSPNSFDEWYERHNYQPPVQIPLKTSDSRILTHEAKDLDTILRDELSDHVYKGLVHEKLARIRYEVETKMRPELKEEILKDSLNFDWRINSDGVQSLAIDDIREDIVHVRDKARGEANRQLGEERQKGKDKVHRHIRRMQRQMEHDLEDEKEDARAKMKLELRNELIEQATIDAQPAIDQVVRKETEAQKKKAVETEREEQLRQLLNDGFGGDAMQLIGLLTKITGHQKPESGAVDSSAAAAETLTSAPAPAVVEAPRSPVRNSRRKASDSSDSDSEPPHQARSKRQAITKPENKPAQHSTSQKAAASESRSQIVIPAMAGVLRGVKRQHDDGTTSEAEASSHKGAKRSRIMEDSEDHDDKDTKIRSSKPIQAAKTQSSRPDLKDNAGSNPPRQTRPTRTRRPAASGANGRRSAPAPQVPAPQEEVVDEDDIWAIAASAGRELGIGSMGEEFHTYHADTSFADESTLVAGDPVVSVRPPGYWEDLLEKEKAKIRLAEKDENGSDGDDDGEEEEEEL